MTEEAHSNKPKLQRWLDEFGENYSKAVVVLSVAIAFFGPVLFKWPLLGTTGIMIFFLEMDFDFRVLTYFDSVAFDDTACR